MFLRAIKRHKDGKLGNLWLMNRGVPTEGTLREMTKSNYHYLVGAPHGHLKILGDRLEKAEWVEVQPGIRVKSARAVDKNGKMSSRLAAHPRSPREGRRHLPAAHQVCDE